MLYVFYTEEFPVVFYMQETGILGNLFYTVTGSPQFATVCIVAIHHNDNLKMEG